MNDFPYKLGKKPARPGAVSFKLQDFVDYSKFPKVPDSFGHEDLIDQRGWYMLGNDTAGDCVIAGGAHEHMLWHREGGSSVRFTTSSVLGDYTALTGYDPYDPSTDTGTDMQEAASYRRRKGLADWRGVRHKIEAYLAIDPGDLQAHYIAVYLFGAVGIGVRFPRSAMEQFNKSQPWTVVKGSKIEGGHYVPLVAKRGDHMHVVTWGRLQDMSVGFFQEYNDESIAYVSKEVLGDNAKSPEGFDVPELRRYLDALPKR